MYTVLICDDDADIVRALDIYLKSEGYETLTAANGCEALEALCAHDVQLALLDVMMPALDGISTTAKIRETSNVPVILLTAKGEDTDKVLGLNVGADDYVTKPFNPVELMARVKSQIRRYTRLGAMQNAPLADAANGITMNGVTLDDEQKRVTVDGEEVALTPTEYSILHLLMLRPGKVFSSREIYRAVWNDEPLAADNVVAVHIRHLREKLEINPAEPRYIRVVWGQGYRFADPARDA